MLGWTLTCKAAIDENCFNLISILMTTAILKELVVSYHYDSLNDLDSPTSVFQPILSQPLLPIERKARFCTLVSCTFPTFRTYYISICSISTSTTTIMASMSKMVDVSSLAGLETILQHSQKDDVAFLVFLVFTGLFYQFFFKDKPDPYHHIWFEKPQATDANAKGADTRDIGQKLEESVSGRYQRLHKHDN
jgi:hypothetical protein